MLRLGLAQSNATVGDIEGNVRRIRRALDQARAAGVQIVAFPELAITGYPPEDLLFKADFVGANLAALDEVTGATGGLIAVVGFVDRESKAPARHRTATRAPANRQNPRHCWGDRRDSNPRPPGPQPGALTELSYGHHAPPLILAQGL